MNLFDCDVLLIDDDPNDIELALLAFSRSDISCTVHTLNDGKEALDYLQGWDEGRRMDGRLPRLIILDLKMPKIDGFEVLTTIRRTPQTAGVPVVILTSSRMPLDIAEAYRRGCNAYVVKPVDYREYTRTMANLIDFWGELNLTPIH